MSLRSTISPIFNIYGVKIVSNNDKVKKAYCLNKKQLSVLEDAGVQPSNKRPAKNFKIHILGDMNTKVVSATYYHAKREGSGRMGEPRLGTEFITDWLEIGDELLLASDGSKVYAMKLNNNNFTDMPHEAVKIKVISDLSDDLITKRANAAPRVARKIKNTSEIYIRDPYIIEVAKRRAKGKCEMPRCTYKAFITESGAPYLEGHHVKPLSENGDDAIENVAALCPLCHREQHFSKDKLDKRNILLKKLKKIFKK